MIVEKVQKKFELYIKSKKAINYYLMACSYKHEPSKSLQLEDFH